MKNKYLVAFKYGEIFEVYGEYEDYETAHKIAYDFNMEIWHDGKRIY